jgi:hypothetical protein
MLAGLDLAGLVADVGPLLVTGSFVSGLMCWREPDVMVHAGGDFSPADVMGLLARIVTRAGVISTPCSMMESVPWTSSRPGLPSADSSHR